MKNIYHLNRPFKSGVVRQQLYGRLTMLKTKTKYTYNDYAAMDDDKRYELIEGELYMVPAPGFYHQTISMNISHPLKKFIKENNLGAIIYAPFDVVLSETDVVQPDIIFVSKGKLGLITEKNLRGAPDLAIEVMVLKETGFETFGIYFIDDELTSSLLRGFRLDSKEVFLS